MTEVLELTTCNPEQTQHLGIALGTLAQPGDTFLLVGGLGAGKTCLTQGIAWGLGVSDCAFSPSFILVREYQGRLPVYHMDLYRLDHIAEILNLGLDDYFYGQGVCVVEWADKGSTVLPLEHLLITITSVSDNKRIFCFEPRGRRYHEIKQLLSLKSIQDLLGTA